MAAAAEQDAGDLYAVLGVTQQVEADELKKVYRKLVLTELARDDNCISSCVSPFGAGISRCHLCFRLTGKGGDCK